ncbi:MAG: RHS repeat-associated core domain-containing protein [Phycisphaerales bacterium]
MFGEVAPGGASLDCDDVHNRTSTDIGGNTSGGGLRNATYASNLLNQYSSRTISRGVDIMGYTPASATSVTVNGSAADYFANDKFYQELVTFPGSGFMFTNVPIDWNPPSGGPEENRWLFVPATPEAFTYDADGNTTSDGRWTYTWDGENRLIRAETMSSVMMRIECVYDYMSRRCGVYMYGWLFGGEEESMMASGATVTDANSSTTVALEDTGEGASGSPQAPAPPGSGWQLTATYKFVWDGWNLSMELDGNNAVVRSMGWGLDLSGSEQGAGGVGGLLFMTETASSQTYHPTYDGNGNVVSVRRGDGVAMSQHEYGPFGETIVNRDTFASLNPWRFSTKYQDGPTGLLYYGYRYYNPGTGRWLSRDRISEKSNIEVNAYTSARNDCANTLDRIGERQFIPWEDFWKDWKKQHASLTTSQLAWAERQLARGCVGVTAASLGSPETFKHCYSTRAQAIKKQSELSLGCGCGKGKRPKLFSIHFWDDTGKDGVNPDVTIDPSTHEADLSNWDRLGRVKTRDPVTGRVIARYYNYDFGFCNSYDEIVHADHYHNPDRDGDGQGDYFPTLPIDTATIYVSDLVEWQKSNLDFNSEVWCVQCNEGPYNGN